MQLALANILRYVSVISIYNCETNETLCPRNVNHSLPDCHFSSLCRPLKVNCWNSFITWEKLKVSKRAQKCKKLNQNYFLNKTNIKF